MKTGAVASCLVMLLAFERAALAEESAAPKPADSTAAAPDDEPAKEPEAPAEAEDTFGHFGQFGLRAGLLGGYRMVFRYDDSPFCRQPDQGKLDKDQQKFCGHGAPLATELALSFAVLDGVEPYAWVRLGFSGEAETNTNALRAFGAGVRIYTMSDSRLKIFVEPGFGLELEDGAGNPDWQFTDSGTPVEPNYQTDMLFHLAVGPQYDFARAVGAYAQVGMTTGVLRSIHTQLEIAGGVQVRVP